jgi:hypothetical protein
VDTFAELGDAGSVLHRHVQHQGTDLVMLATHGRDPIRRFLLGSVAAKALHDISAAVWTATAEILTGRTSQAVYRSILCPLDESDEAKVVLQTAAAFAAWFCAPARLDGFCTSAVPLASMLHPAS